MPPHVLCGLRGPPSWAWQQCNRLLRLGRPWGAVTLSRWCVSGDTGGCSARRGLKPKLYWSTQTMVTAGVFPFKENSHGRAGNRTRDLMISSQRLWPLDHEAGRNWLCSSKDFYEILRGCIYSEQVLNVAALTDAVCLGMYQRRGQIICQEVTK